MSQPEEPQGRSLQIYCIAIGGTGMAPLAALLQVQGHRVRGADGPLYPPMSTLLAEIGIVPHVGYDAAHLTPPPDLVIVGNAVPRTNPEAEEVERRGIPRISMPEALARFLLRGRRPLVVAGTHGKTTTTALAAFTWGHAGRDPGFLVGGLPVDLGVSFRLGSGERFIIEGDEYNAAYFDRGAKFLHYQPQTVILTSAEHDHADLYPTPESLLEAYGKLIDLIPEDGELIACGDWPSVRALATRAKCRVIFYGLGEGNDISVAGNPECGPWGMSFAVLERGARATEITLPLWGEHNVTNALGVYAAGRSDGLSPEELARAFASFHGVARRLQELGTAAGVTVVDDFAHHPTAVERTLVALRQRYPGRRLAVLYEPRSLTAGRSFFHAAYRQAFALADRVLFAPIFHRARLGPEDGLDREGLVGELLALGRAAAACTTNDDVLARALAEARPGDVVVAMSSGSFDGLPRRLLAALREREGTLDRAFGGETAP